MDSTCKCNKAGDRKVSCGTISAFQPTRVKGALMGYKQLTSNERYQINILLKTGYNQTEIAKEVHVHKSTISRELKRNRGKRGYRHKQAQRFADQRRRKEKRRITAEDWKIIERYLKKDFSPEQVSHWVLMYFGIQVSAEWI